MLFRGWAWRPKNQTWEPLGTTLAAEMTSWSCPFVITRLEPFFLPNLCPALQDEESYKRVSDCLHPGSPIHAYGCTKTGREKIWTNSLQDSQFPQVVIYHPTRPVHIEQKLIFQKEIKVLLGKSVWVAPIHTKNPAEISIAGGKNSTVMNWFWTCLDFSLAGDVGCVMYPPWSFVSHLSNVVTLTSLKTLPEDWKGHVRR